MPSPHVLYFRPHADMISRRTPLFQPQPYFDASSVYAFYDFQHLYQQDRNATCLNAVEL